MYKSLDKAREDIRRSQSKPPDDGIEPSLPLSGPALPLADEEDTGRTKPRGPLPAGSAGY